MVEGEGPDPVVGLLAYAGECSNELVIVGEDAGVELPEAVGTGAGEGGEVQYKTGFEGVFGIIQTIGEDEAAFGVGVLYFYGEAFATGEDVAGLVGVFVDEILADAADTDDAFFCF